MLETVISAGRVNDYYETVFSDLADEGSLALQKTNFDGKPWYEIDMLADLQQAEKTFPVTRPAATLIPPVRIPVLDFLKAAPAGKVMHGV